MGHAIADSGFDHDSFRITGQTPITAYSPHAPIKINNNTELLSQFPGGIITKLSINTNISNGIFIGNTTVGITISGNSVTSTGFPFDPPYSSCSGVTLYNVTNADVENNYFSSDLQVVELYSCKNVTVNNNQPVNGAEGITVQDAINCTIEHNTIYNMRFDGIGVYSSTNISVLKNSVSCDAGLSMFSISIGTSFHCTIEGNDVGDAYWDGIYMDSSNNNILSSNTCSANAQYGIELTNASNNIVTLNKVTGNSRFGIDIGHDSRCNRIHHNNIIDNNGAGPTYDSSHVQANDSSGPNFWNTSIEGNYWSDLTGPDENGDGIVDFPYILENGTKDNYPLAPPKYSSHKPIHINSDADFNAQFPDRVISGYDISGAGYRYCIYVGNCSKSFTIEECYLHEANETYPSSSSGLTLYNVLNSTVVDCNISSNAIGILTSLTSNISFLNNNLFSNTGGILIYNSNKTTIQNNNIFNTDYEAIELYDSSDNLVSSNIISNSWTGISVINHPEIYSEQKILGSLETAQITQCINNTIFNNAIFNNAVGVEFYCSLSNVSDNRIFSNSASGLVLYGVSDVVSNNLIIKNNFSGIELGGYFNEVRENNISWNNNSGILLKGYSSTIINNIFSFNRYYGVNATWNGSSPRLYRIHHNDFIGNNNGGKQAYDPVKMNIWNTSTEGNYWSDWTYPDNDSNGIVDIPYVIEGNSGAKDYYPLTHPYGQAKNYIPAPGFPIFLAASIVLCAIVTIGVILVYVPSFYTRIRRENVLDHFVRGQIYDHIRKNPGAYYNNIRNEFNLKPGTALYHLRTLELQGFIKSERKGMHRCYYMLGTKTGEESKYSEFQYKILKTIKERPGMSQSEIAHALGVRRSVMNYNIRKLIELGVLRVELDGRRQKCFIVE